MYIHRCRSGNCNPKPRESEMERPEDESRVHATVWGPSGKLTESQLITRAADIIERQGWLQEVMFERPTTKEGWQALFDDFDWYGFDENGFEYDVANLVVASACSTCIYQKPEGFAHVKVCTIGALNIAAYGVGYKPAYGQLPHRAAQVRAIELIQASLHGLDISTWNDGDLQTAEEVVKHLRKVAKDAA